MFAMSRALRAVVDRATARHAIQAGVLTMENLANSTAVLALERIVLDHLPAILTLDARYGSAMIYDHVPHPDSFLSASCGHAPKYPIAWLQL